MHRLTVLYPAPADPAHFRDHYTRVHLPLAAKLPGLVRMQHAFDVEGLGEASPYFAIFHGDFESAEAMAAALGSAEGKVVSADVANYATGGAHLVHYELS